MPSLVDKLLGRGRSRQRRLLRRFIRPAWLGTLQRTTPLSDDWGYDRGTPIDRYYIEHFLDEHRSDIRGRVLEIKDSTYTNRFGVNVEQRDVLDINPSNPCVTIVADLSAADSVPADTFDCIILTQTLQYIYPVQAAVTQACRLLRPGGVLLATLPSITRMDPEFLGTDHWRFTVDSCRALLGGIFGQEQVEVRAYGNVLTAIAFLEGIAYEELGRRDLEAYDYDYPVTIAARAVKRSAKVPRE